MNCFQISTLLVESQPYLDLSKALTVVNCFQISTLLVESQHYSQINWVQIVVNCFQISTLLVESQLALALIVCSTGCELLSNQYFTSRITAQLKVITYHIAL